MQERVIDLEVRYSHLERLVEELSAVVWEQRRQLEALERRTKELEGRLRAQDEPEGDAPPPHY